LVDRMNLVAKWWMLPMRRFMDPGERSIAKHQTPVRGKALPHSAIPNASAWRETKVYSAPLVARTKVRADYHWTLHDRTGADRAGTWLCVCSAIWGLLMCELRSESFGMAAEVASNG
jgi:hypothetical protein